LETPGERQLRETNVYRCNEEEEERREKELDGKMRESGRK
jgi:hypothetical protein